MKDGVIADFTVTEQMLKHFITQGARVAPALAQPAHHHLRAVRLHPGGTPRHPRIRASVPAPGRCILIEEPIAAAIGAADLPVADATGSM
jgi:rod shape-determining protein MreB